MWDRARADLAAGSPWAGRTGQISLGAGKRPGRGWSRKQEEKGEKWKSSGKGEARRGATGTAHTVTERLRFPAPPEDRPRSPRGPIQAGVGARGESEPHIRSILPAW